MPMRFSVHAILARAWRAMAAHLWLCLFVILSLGALALTWLVQTPGMAAGVVAPLAHAKAPATSQRRCESCGAGVVEAIRELTAEAGSGKRRFEMTIRMRDGTMRVSNETGGARWRSGDKVQLIGIQAKP
jgi:hypothetical protein